MDQINSGREPFNSPGIASLSDEGCIMEIGCVSASATRETVQALVDGYHWIKSQKDIAQTNNVYAPWHSGKSGWMSFGLDKDKALFTLNLRGVAWQVDETTMDKFIETGAIPFLARGTSNQLLKMCNIGSEQQE